MEEQPSAKKCILEISELDFIRINERLKQTIGTKSMSKLSQEMLTMKIDKHLRTELGTGNPLAGLLTESLEGLQGLLATVQDRDKKSEALVAQIKTRNDELEKMKAQMAAVLTQFKAEREKHAAKVAEMEKLLKERQDCLNEGDKVKASAEMARKSKMEETFTKLFEKNTEISSLKEELETCKSELALTQSKLSKVEAHLRNCLDLNGTDNTVKIADNQEKYIAQISDKKGPDSSEESEELMYRFFGIMKIKKVRSYILSSLGIEDIFRLKTSCMYMYRVVSSDFSIVKTLESCLKQKFERKSLILEKSLSRNS